MSIENAKLFEIAKSLNLPIYQNKIFGEFFIIPTTDDVVSSIYAISDDLSARIENNLKINTVDEVPVETLKLIELNKLYSKSKGSGAWGALEMLRKQKLTAEKIGLLSKLASSELSMNKVINKLGNAELLELLPDGQVTSTYFDFVDRETVSLSPWVRYFSSLVLVGDSVGKIRSNVDYTIPHKIEVIQSIMDTVVNIYTPTCYLPGGSDFKDLPLPTLRPVGFMMGGW